MTSLNHKETRHLLSLYIYCHSQASIFKAAWQLLKLQQLHFYFRKQRGGKGERQIVLPNLAVSFLWGPLCDFHLSLTFYWLKLIHQNIISHYSIYLKLSGIQEQLFYYMDGFHELGIYKRHRKNYLSLLHNVCCLT